MKSTVANRKTTKKSSRLRAGPTWDIAQLFPQQGAWTEEEYLALDTNRLIEFTNGFLEFLPMPSFSHQGILKLLCKILCAFVEPELGEVFFAPARVRVAPKKYREPDMLFLFHEHKDWINKDDQFCKCADLVMEVVSPGKESRERDLVAKRKDYARAGIAEYWIVDPKARSITVLHLKGKKYERVGVFKPGNRAESRLLPGFFVEVSGIFSGRAK